MGANKDRPQRPTGNNLKRPLTPHLSWKLGQRAKKLRGKDLKNLATNSKVSLSTVYRKKKKYGHANKPTARRYVRKSFPRHPHYERALADAVRTKYSLTMCLLLTS